jgi:hypothetical protein
MNIFKNFFKSKNDKKEHFKPKNNDSKNENKVFVTESLNYKDNDQTVILNIEYFKNSYNTGAYIKGIIKCNNKKADVNIRVDNKNKSLIFKNTKYSSVKMVSWWTSENKVIGKCTILFNSIKVTIIFCNRWKFIIDKQ